MDWENGLSSGRKSKMKADPEHREEIFRKELQHRYFNYVRVIHKKEDKKIQMIKKIKSLKLK